MPDDIPLPARTHDVGRAAPVSKCRLLRVLNEPLMTVSGVTEFEMNVINVIVVVVVGGGVGVVGCCSCGDGFGFRWVSTYSVVSLTPERSITQ